MCENLSLSLVSTTFQSLVITSPHSIGRVLRIYRGSEGALDKNYTHNINLNHWPIRYISMPLHIIAGRRWNTSADPINQSKRCPVRGIYTIMIVKSPSSNTIMIVKSPSLLVQTWGAAIVVSANTGRRHGAAMFRVNWRPHPAELMRPGVNFGVPVGWGLRWCSDVYPRLRATAAGHPHWSTIAWLGSALVFRRRFIPVRHGFFLRRG